MKRLVAITTALIMLAVIVPTVSAATTWTARMGSYGVATLRNLDTEPVDAESPFPAPMKEPRAGRESY